MDIYKYVFDMLQGHLEFVDRKSIKALHDCSEEYRKTMDEINDIMKLTWFDDFLNGKSTTSITPENIKTIHRFMNLQSSIDYDLKVMYYLYGTQDASILSEVYKNLNDYIATRN